MISKIHAGSHQLQEGVKYCSCIWGGHRKCLRKKMVHGGGRDRETVSVTTSFVVFAFSVCNFTKRTGFFTVQPKYSKFSSLAPLALATNPIQTWLHWGPITRVCAPVALL